MNIREQYSNESQLNLPSTVINTFLDVTRRGDLSLLRKFSDKLCREYGNRLTEAKKLFQTLYYQSLEYKHTDLANYLVYGFMPVILTREPNEIELSKVKRGEKLLLIYDKKTKDWEIVFANHNADIIRKILITSNINNTNCLIIDEFNKTILQTGLIQIIEHGIYFSDEILSSLITILKFNGVQADGLFAGVKLALHSPHSSDNAIFPPQFHDRFPLSAWIKSLGNIDNTDRRQYILGHIGDYPREVIIAELMDFLNTLDLINDKEEILRLHYILKHTSVNPEFHQRDLSEASVRLAIKLNHIELFSHLIMTSIYYPLFLEQMNKITISDSDTNHFDKEMKLIIFICQHVVNMQHWQQILAFLQETVTSKILISNYFMTLNQCYTNIDDHLFHIRKLLIHPAIHALHDKNDWNQLLMMIDLGEEIDSGEDDLLTYYSREKIHETDFVFETGQLTYKRKHVDYIDDDIFFSNKIRKLSTASSFTFFSLISEASNQYYLSDQSRSTQHSFFDSIDSFDESIGDVYESIDENEIENNALELKISQAWPILRQAWLVIHKFDYDENLVIPPDIYFYIMYLVYMTTLDANQEILPSETSLASPRNTF